MLTTYYVSLSGPKYISRKCYERQTIENLKPDKLNELIKEIVNYGSTKLQRLSVGKANLFLSLTKVYDNFVCVTKGDQAMDVKRLK